MIDVSQGLYRNITLNDVQLAAAYYPILINLAKHKHCLTYGELVKEAQKKYPKNITVKNAIAVSTGRKLDVVRIFTNDRNLPDVTSLIINKNKGECGTGFTENFNPSAARERVFSFNWEGISTDFDLYIELIHKEIAPRKRRGRNEALKLLSKYYFDHKDSLPKDIKESREAILEFLVEGFEIEDSFTRALNK